MDDLTYYINEAMLGDEGTERDARRMVALLQEWGYNVEYGVVIANKVDGPTDEDWDAAIEMVGVEKYYLQPALHDEGSNEEP
jgi:predicted GTPase